MTPDDGSDVKVGYEEVDDETIKIRIKWNPNIFKDPVDSGKERTGSEEF